MSTELGRPTEGAEHLTEPLPGAVRGGPRWWVRPLRVIVVGVAAVALGVGLTMAYDAVVGPPAPRVGQPEQELIRLVNAVRARASCPAVTADPALMAAAQGQAEDMVTRGFLHSVNPDGLDPVARARRLGYRGGVTESFAAGLATPAEVVTQWSNPKNAFAAAVLQRLRTCRMVRIGVGHDTGTALPSLGAHVWVMDLGDR